MLDGPQGRFRLKLPYNNSTEASAIACGREKPPWQAGGADYVLDFSTTKKLEFDPNQFKTESSKPMAGENLTPPGRREVGWVGSPLGGQFHSSAGSGSPPAEEV